MANRHRGEVDMGREFGPGCVLRLDYAGAAALEARFGNTPQRELVWPSVIMQGCSVPSPDKIGAVLEVALRNDKGSLLAGSGDIPEHKVGSLFDLGQKCRDALVLFLHGKTFAEWAAGEMEEGDDEDADPPNGAVVL